MSSKLVYVLHAETSQGVLFLQRISPPENTLLEDRYALAADLLFERRFRSDLAPLMGKMVTDALIHQVLRLVNELSSSIQRVSGVDIEVRRAR